MLTIFKNFEAETSIIEDFDFYEERQKAMQERKARLQTSLMGITTVGEGERKSAAPSNINGDFVKQISKSFAQAVRLDDSSTEPTGTERGGLTTDASDGTAVKPEVSVPVTSSSPQSS